MSERETVQDKSVGIETPWPYEITESISGRELAAFLHAHALSYDRVPFNPVAHGRRVPLDQMTVHSLGENKWRYFFHLWADLPNWWTATAMIHADSETPEATRDLLPGFIESAEVQLRASLVEAYMYSLLIDHFQAEVERGGE